MGLLAKNLNIDLPLDRVDFHIMLAIVATPLDSNRILQFVSEQSNYTLEAGLQTIYAHISQLLKERWIEQTAGIVNDGNPRRQTYELTAYGRHVLKAEIHRLETLVKHAYVVGLMED